MFLASPTLSFVMPRGIATPSGLVCVQPVPLQRLPALLLGAGAREHAGGEVDAAGAAGEGGGPGEQEAGAAPDLEQVAARAEAADEIDLEVVDEVVVAAGILAAVAILVAVRELVVIGARGVDVVVVAGGGRCGHRGVALEHRTG